jgi:hypothetical protein
MKPMNEEGHNPQYTEHRAESDRAAETLKELVIMNKIMHDGINEAQAMIGDQELTIKRLELELRDARNQLLLLTSRATRHITFKI